MQNEQVRLTLLSLWNCDPTSTCNPSLLLYSRHRQSLGGEEAKWEVDSLEVVGRYRSIFHYHPNTFLDSCSWLIPEFRAENRQNEQVDLTFL
jgi:hypothetical protein